MLVTLSGEGHVVFKASNTNEKEIEQLKDFVVKNYGRLDVLVNNAGITTPVAHDDLEGLTNDYIDRIMQTNFRGGFAMLRAFKNLLLQTAKDTNEPTVVVNISSIAGQFGVGSNVAYCASKAAVDSMTRSLARALAPNIRVLSVSPGWVLGDYTINIDPEYIKAQENATPLNRLANANDVANAVWSAATQLTFSTGGIISVDGGRLLGK
jgi:3-oxoacyl-[acyl-carrier protein] reductase